MTTEIKLAPPGAGLPWIQKIIIKIFVLPRSRKSLDPAKAIQVYQKTAAAILRQVSNLSSDQLSTQVLISPTRGLEDSSRYWSVAMTLEHINIVSTGMHGLIHSLLNDKVPSGEISTADVKPPVGVAAAESVEKFKNTYEKTLADLMAIEKNPETANKLFRAEYKKAHPWFGPMTAAQWFWLIGMHQGIHLQQIKKILKHQ